MRLFLKLGPDPLIFGLDRLIVEPDPLALEPDRLIFGPDRLILKLNLLILESGRLIFGPDSLIFGRCLLILEPDPSVFSWVPLPLSPLPSPIVVAVKGKNDVLVFPSLFEDTPKYTGEASLSSGEYRVWGDVKHDGAQR